MTPRVSFCCLMQEMETVIEDKDEKTQVLEGLLDYIVCTTQESQYHEEISSSKVVGVIGEECIQEEELLYVLTKKPQLICYEGFEPSDRTHIAQGVMKTINVYKLTFSGCKAKIWIADWFAQLNNKMGGDLNKIQTVKKYLIDM
ncbi:hypothetical protein L2E82_08168 [Cichorium intybus]|uniref:Uncharacterized protein n=1 Tax=Cichorium intybus TaxID=13427 RepID=A0ACB9G5I8_CICIN|nr:hypothetical protein L2E82_08168 [Cichorium intybus]